MPTVLQFRRGTTSQNNNFTGSAGELSIDTQIWNIRVHDGSTPGGSNIATTLYVDQSISSLSADSISNGTSQVKVISSGGNILANVGGSTIGTFYSSGLTLGSTALTVGSITNGGSNGTGNIGSSVGYFNTVFAKATSAQYADVAERYVADRSYEPGTVLEIGGILEVTETTAAASTKIAGIVSTAPAVIMNSAENSETAVTVALLGRVPCKVVGPISRGDLLCSSDEPGHAQALSADRYQPGCVIGKALENYNSTSPGVIEVMVGRL